MILAWLYGLSIVGIIAAAAVVIGLMAWRRSLQPFSTYDLATAAVLICLMYIAVMPWQIGLSRVPGLDALIFSIPYTAMFLIGLRLVPKGGFATLLICGQGILGQLLSRGINPAWWPYYIGCAVVVEISFLAVGSSLHSLTATIVVGMLRGAMAYCYMYLLLAPFLWHQFYAAWYVAAKIIMGLLGSAIGAWLAWRFSPQIEKAAGRSLP